MSLALALAQAQAIASKCAALNRDWAEKWRVAGSNPTVDKTWQQGTSSQHHRGTFEQGAECPNTYLGSFRGLPCPCPYSFGIGSGTLPVTPEGIINPHIELVFHLNVKRKSEHPIKSHLLLLSNNDGLI